MHRKIEVNVWFMFMFIIVDSPQKMDENSSLTVAALTYEGTEGL